MKSLWTHLMHGDTEQETVWQTCQPNQLMPPFARVSQCWCPGRFPLWRCFLGFRIKTLCAHFGMPTRIFSKEARLLFFFFIQQPTQWKKQPRLSSHAFHSIILSCADSRVWEVPSAMLLLRLYMDHWWKWLDAQLMKSCERSSVLRVAQGVLRSYGRWQIWS